MAIASKVTIEIAGNRVPDFRHFSIHQGMYQPHHFSLVCRRDIFERSGESPLASSINKIGSVVTFLIEGIDSGVNSSDLFFKGIITRISSSGGNSYQEIVFSGYSPDFLLKGYKTCRSFENMTLRQIAEEVFRPYPRDQISLTGNSDFNLQFSYVVQYNENNYDFLLRLARRFGQWFFYNGRELVFGNFQKETRRGVQGINISNFNLNANMAPLKFNICTRDWIADEVIERSSTDSTADITGDLDAIGRHIHDQSLSSFPEVGKLYFPQIYNKNDGTLNRDEDNVRHEKEGLAAGFVMISGSGSEPLKLGEIFHIEIPRSGQDREIEVGDFLVTGLDHYFDNSLNYSNSFRGIPSSLPVPPETSVQLSAFCQTQSAIVKDNSDPKKLGRVRVQFTWQERNQMTPWIRMVNPHAGSEQGFYFIPEIGQEVLVGFEGGDPQQPYVIGQMYNGGLKPDPNWITSSNDIKSLRTKSGHTIEFNDTSGSEQLVIYNGSGSSAGSNNNKIVLSLNPDKIIVESQGDIELKGNNIKVDAQGSIDLHATSGLTLKTESGDASLQGTQVSVKADGQFKAEGATAEVSGSGMAKIQGGIVQIN